MPPLKTGQCVLHIAKSLQPAFFMLRIIGLVAWHSSSVWTGPHSPYSPSIPLPTIFPQTSRLSTDRPAHMPTEAEADSASVLSTDAESMVYYDFDEQAVVNGLAEIDLSLRTATPFSLSLTAERAITNAREHLNAMDKRLEAARSGLNAAVERMGQHGVAELPSQSQDMTRLRDDLRSIRTRLHRSASTASARRHDSHQRSVSASVLPIPQQARSAQARKAFDELRRDIVHSLALCGSDLERANPLEAQEILAIMAASLAVLRARPR